MRVWNGLSWNEPLGFACALRQLGKGFLEYSLACDKELANALPDKTTGKSVPRLPSPIAGPLEIQLDPRPQATYMFGVSPPWELSCTLHVHMLAQSPSHILFPALGRQR